jgi:hypothetical protein
MVPPAECLERLASGIDAVKHGRTVKGDNFHTLAFGVKSSRLYMKLCVMPTRFNRIHVERMAQRVVKSLERYFPRLRARLPRGSILRTCLLDAFEAPC